MLQIRMSAVHLWIIYSYIFTYYFSGDFPIFSIAILNNHRVTSLFMLFKFHETPLNSIKPQHESAACLPSMTRLNSGTPPHDGHRLRINQPTFYHWKINIHQPFSLDFPMIVAWFSLLIQTIFFSHRQIPTAARSWIIRRRSWWTKCWSFGLATCALVDRRYKQISWWFNQVIPSKTGDSMGIDQLKVVI